MLKALAVTTALVAIAAPAHAEWTTQPGETVGLASGTPLPPGLYFVNTFSWGDHRSAAEPNDLIVDIPVLAWSTPWHILGARLQLLGATPALEYGGETELYNVFGAGQLAWDLGRGWGVSYLIGAYSDAPGDLGVQSGNLNQRLAVSYTGGGWNLTANLIHNLQFEDEVADSMNLDLTATKKFGKWEIGLVGFGSWDLDKRADGKEYSQFALGGLIGYNFGPVIWQAYLTRDVSTEEYAEEETRFWTRVIVPLRTGEDRIESIKDAPLK